MSNIKNSWIEVPVTSDFPIQNIPFGVVKLSNGKIVCASRIGNTVIDLATLYSLGYFQSIPEFKHNLFNSNSLNNFIACGKPIWQKVRNILIRLFDVANLEAQRNLSVKNIALYGLNEVEMMLPVEIGDYTDFYSSIEHATNVGKMFRDPGNALLPNWKHIPVGYHGRSSSIVVSGTNIHRPKGQIKPADQVIPSFGPTRAMDFELEMAFITGGVTELGESIPIEKAEDYIFGMVIFNDLSARDIQAWEYVPLGPFLGKSFGSVISPWIVTLDALEPFRTASPKQDTEVLPYLQYSGDRSFDLKLEVFLEPENGEENLVCLSNFKYLYWNMCQQLAHQSVNGCNINIGDMYASGTISGSSEDSFGSMLELTWQGSKPLKLKDGTMRKFIIDNDSIIMRASNTKDGVRIGFGESRTKILKAKA